MHNKRPPIPAIIILLFIIGFSAYFVITQNAEAQKSTELTASGTIETVQTHISAEMSGKVVEVLVNEGDSVQAGDVLFRLDDTLLRAQLNAATASRDTAQAAVTTAEAALSTAQTQYALALTAAQVEEQALRTTDWKLSKPGDFDQPTWYFTREEQYTAIQAEVDASQKALTKAEDNLKFYEEKATSADFLAAEKDLLEARAAYQVAQDVFDRTNGASDGQDLRDAAQTALDDAKANLDDAQKAYDDALTTEGATDVLTARAELRVVQERLGVAQDRLRTYQVGMHSPKLEAAQKVVDQAQAAVNQAHTAIAQTEAQIALIEAQLTKLVVTAPGNGIVLTRSVEPGEFTAPGAVILTLAQLDQMTITVYVPEDRYGEVSLGQAVDVTVDSSPEVFSAIVTRISDKAQFTPRNVQTTEGRKSTVYAIELKLNNPSDALKIGMPADVLFK